MANVFISYSQKDRATAQQLAAKLTAKGLSVLWDSQIVGGEKFRAAIEEQLKAAKVVVVLWSPKRHYFQVRHRLGRRCRGQWQANLRSAGSLWCDANSYWPSEFSGGQYKGRTRP
jgi:TIR domain